MRLALFRRILRSNPTQAVRAIASDCVVAQTGIRRNQLDQGTTTMAWKTVLTSDSLGEGQSLELLLGGNIVAVFRHGGELFAIDGICMHQGGPLARGKLANGTIQCPWHGWMYELKTGNNAVTCQPMLRTYPIQENDGRIEIDFDS